MRPRIPEYMIKKYEGILTKKELQTIVANILAVKTMKLRKAQVIKLAIPHIGTIRSHGKRKRNGINKYRTRDRKKKNRIRKQKELDPKRLLF